MAKSFTKMEYAENGIIIRYDFDNAPEVYETEKGELSSRVESYHDIISKAYGELIANNMEIEAEEIDKEQYFGLNVKIEITPIRKEKDLFFKTK